MLVEVKGSDPLGPNTLDLDELNAIRERAIAMQEVCEEIDLLSNISAVSAGDNARKDWQPFWSFVE